MTREELEACLSVIDARRADLQGRMAVVDRDRDRVLAVLAGPRVLPVAHYWCHGEHLAQGCATVAEAFAFLDNGAESGELGPDCVTVGGALIEREER